MSLTANAFGEMLFGDLLPVNILSVTEDRYLPAIENFLAAEQAYLNQLTSVLCDTGKEPQTGFSTGVGGLMQKMGKRGGVEATRGGQRWFVAFPLFAFGNKQLYEVPWLQRATFVELAWTILDAMLSDIRTTITEMLTALLSNANYTYDDSQWPGMNAQFVGQASGPLTIRRLANADGAVGSVYARGVETQIGTLQHYLTSGSGTLAVTAFTAARDKLRNVGNDADIAVLVSRADADYVVDNFASTDYTPPVEVLDRYLAQDAFGKYATQTKGLLDPGFRSRGRVRNMELIEAPHWPVGYLCAFDRSKEPPLRRRISDLANEQGLHLASENGDLPDVQSHPLARKQWRRIQGFGARNRTNAVVVQVTAGGYTVPAIP